jgi:hypothetical protein
MRWCVCAPPAALEEIKRLLEEWNTLLSLHPYQMGSWAGHYEILVIFQFARDSPSMGPFRRLTHDVGNPPLPSSGTFVSAPVEWVYCKKLVFSGACGSIETTQTSSRKLLESWNTWIQGISAICAYLHKCYDDYNI